LIGGPGFEVADDWAALLACGVIVFNGVRLLLPALNEVMDGAVQENIENQIISIAQAVNGVLEIEKCRVRKSGLGLLMDIHVIVQEDLTVREGHKIGHDVKDALLESDLNVLDVIVHIEPGEIVAREQVIGKSIDT
jgi:divalent metal cation (Fe/Co/Zn/Cd) transporter